MSLLERVAVASVLLEGATAVPGCGDALDDVCAKAPLAPPSANAIAPHMTERLEIESMDGLLSNEK
jgi:hypothetical protein